MSEKEIDIQEVLAYFRELVGQQAQEIALLRASLVKTNQQEDKVE
jgi:hypothetical protein